MNKGLEALNSLAKLEECAYAMKDLPMSNWIDLAENEAKSDLKIMNWTEESKFELFKGQRALQRLEEIDNAKPSEAMESLERIDKEYATIENEDFKICFNTIKQALIKAQEQEKVLKIIKENNVDVFFLRNNCDTVEEYNKEINNNTMHYCYGNCRELTQEEFNLLIKVFSDKHCEVEE